MGNRWNTRPATAQDALGILHLFREVFGDDRSLAHWTWKFVENPANKICISLAEDCDRDRIVGQCAMLPTWMNVQGREVMGAQALDLMTDPDYRRQGMFVSLAKECLSQAGSDGVSVLYGFPNEQAYPGWVNKLGWLDVGRLPSMLKVTNRVIVTSVIQRWVKIPALAVVLARPAYLALQFWAMEHRPKVTRGICVQSVDAF